MRCLKNFSLVASNCAALPSLCLFVLCALHYDVGDAHHLKAQHFFGQMDVGPKNWFTVPRNLRRLFGCWTTFLYTA